MHKDQHTHTSAVLIRYRPPAEEERHALVVLAVMFGFVVSDWAFLLLFWQQKEPKSQSSEYFPFNKCVDVIS